MQNEVWEQVGHFLNKLRCENMSRDTVVEIPGFKNTQCELEMLRVNCEKIINNFSEEEHQTILEWMEKLEDMNSLEGQKAYCQGYVDCILLLSGLGLFRKDLSPKKIIKKYNNERLIFCILEIMHG